MCSEAAVKVFEDILENAARLDPETARELLDSARLRLPMVVSDVVEKMAAPDIALQRVEHLGSGTLLGYEALARFGGGTSTADSFRLAAERGVAVDLELVTLQAALDRLGEIPDGIFLGINLSAPALFDERVMDVLRQVDSRFVVVELTPQGEIDDVAGLRARFRQLHEMGITVAVDSAGVGFFREERLLEVHPEVIKIARSIVSGCDLDEEKRAQLASLTALGRRIGALVIAVGVETTGELAVLERLGVDAVQGHWIAQPSIDIDVDVDVAVGSDTYSLT